MDRTLKNQSLETENRSGKFIAVILIALLYVALLFLDNMKFVPGSTVGKTVSMLIPVLRKGAIYALLCVSMNLLNGFTGLFSLGQAGFMLIGAYAYAVFSIPAGEHASVYQYFNGGLIQFSIPEILGDVMGETAGNVVGAIICILIAGCVTAIFAALIGIPCLRFKSDYLAIATLGFAEIIRAVFQWEGMGYITNGANLLRKYTTFGDMTLKVGATNIKFGSVFVFLIAMLSIIFILLLIHSSYGRAYKAIRDDEIAAEAMGVNLFKHKMQAFVISSFFAGVGGALLAMYQTTIQAAPFKSAMTYEILLMVVIGGIGSVSGSCIAAFLYIACNEWWLRFLDSGSLFGIVDVPFFRDGFRKVVFSVIIMIIVLFFSRGIMGDKELSFKGIQERRRKRKAAKAAKAQGGDTV